MSSVEQDDSRDQVHRGQEISSELVIARSDTTVMLDFVPETLGKIALAVERKIAVAPLLSVFPWRDHWSDCSLIEDVDQRIGIVSLVADESARIGSFEQRFRGGQIMRLPRCQHQVERIAQGIDEHVDFGAQSSARFADGLCAVFFRAPALC